jgi:MFS transporter, FHS family, L-fucose permease
MPPQAPKATAALWPVLLITGLFFFWGMANNLNDILIPHFKSAFALSDFESSFVQQYFYFGYFVFALPAGFFMRKYGYKAAVVAGLGLFACGALMFYPASQAGEYRWFLGALFVIASGLAFLETSANPLMTLLGDAKGAAFRLNLAQSFNPLGSLTGILIGQHFIFTQKTTSAEAITALTPEARHAHALETIRSVQLPYVFIGLFILGWAVLVIFSKFPASVSQSAQPSEPEPSIRQSLLSLLAHKRYRLGVIAQFFYVGAQIGLFSYMIRYGGHELLLNEKDAANYVTAALILFAAGRFIGTGLMRYVSPTRVLGLFAVANIALSAVAILIGGQWGLYAMVGSAAFMSIMFPTIFATSVRGLGPLTKIGSSFLVMSIIGGAVLTALMGLVSDLSNIRMAIGVPLVCFVVIALFGFSAPPEDNTPPDLSRGH